MIYESNLECLNKNHNAIYKAITDDSFSWNRDEAIVCDAKNQEKIVAYKRNDSFVYLNSKYNPSKEAEKYLEDLADMREKSILTMFGFANGSFIKEILSKTNEEVTIIVYEPSVSIFMQAVENIDITSILSNGRVILVIDGINPQYYKDVMGRLLQTYNKSTSRHVVLPKYADLFPQQCKQFVEMTNEIYEKLQILANTLDSSGKIICKNNIMNMKYLPGCRSGVDFVNLFPEDMPAIVVSAGPSLAKNKHLLKEAKGKALIIVVDTAIKQIMSMGIKPDMVISVDYAKELRHFEQEGLSDIPFVAEGDSSVDVLELVKPANLIFCAADSVLWENLFDKAGSSIRYLDRGGSVATVAIASAISWGIKRIILIGQDLTFTGGVVHAGEEATEFDFSTGKYAYVKGINGEDLVTRKDYLTYLRWIENIAYKCQDVDIIDATEGGALKEHTRVMTFREAIDSYCNTEYDIAGLINSVPRLFEGEDSELIPKALLDMKKNLSNLKKLLVEVAVECHKGSMMLARGDFNVKELKKINSAIEKIDDRLLESEERVLISKLDASIDKQFDEDVYEIENDDIKESIRLYEKCEKYYTGIAKVIPELVELIDTCLNDINS